MTQSDKWKGREVVDRYWAYAGALRAGFNRTTKFHLCSSVRVLAVFATPHEALYGKPHQVKPDADNILKGVMDSLILIDEGTSTVFCDKVWGAENRISIVLDGVVV